MEARKIKNLNPSAICKKFPNGQYQLYFEFASKVLLPRTEKRTIATMADLYVKEVLDTLVEINLSALMIEYISVEHN